MESDFEPRMWNSKSNVLSTTPCCILTQWSVFFSAEGQYWEKLSIWLNIWLGVLAWISNLRGSLRDKGAARRAAVNP